MISFKWKKFSKENNKNKKKAEKTQIARILIHNSVPHDTKPLIELKKKNTESAISKGHEINNFK